MAIALVPLTLAVGHLGHESDLRRARLRRGSFQKMTRVLLPESQMWNLGRSVRFFERAPVPCPTMSICGRAGSPGLDAAGSFLSLVECSPSALRALRIGGLTFRRGRPNKHHIRRRPCEADEGWIGIYAEADAPFPRIALIPSSMRRRALVGPFTPRIRYFLPICS
jgi:hypothetical protein